MFSHGLQTRLIRVPAAAGVDLRPISSGAFRLAPVSPGFSGFSIAPDRTPV
jgi:hypothetical protein